MGQRLIDTTAITVGDAYRAAEARANEGYTGVIIFPDSRWRMYTDAWPGVPDGWSVRFASERLIPAECVDTVIAVGSLDVEGLALAAEMLQHSLTPLWVDFPCDFWD